MSETQTEEVVVVDEGTEVVEAGEVVELTDADIQQIAEEVVEQEEAIMAEEVTA